MLLHLNTRNHRHLVQNYFHTSSSNLDLNRNFLNDLLARFENYNFNLIEYFKNFISFDTLKHMNQENYS
jgi:hypothetical protein